MENEKDFDYYTMKKATQEDVLAMWFQLWGEQTAQEVFSMYNENNDVLDRTQTNDK